MTAAYFEDHPTDPDKVILRKPRLDQGPDYERGFIDGMKHQMQSSVDKAINAMTQRTWVGLTDEEVDECYYWKDRLWTTDELVRHVEAKLKEKNT